MPVQAGAGVPATHQGSGTVVVTVTVSPTLALLRTTEQHPVLSPTSAQGWSLEQQPAPPLQLSGRLGSSCSATITLT